MSKEYKVYINSLTEAAPDITADFIEYYDTSAGQMKKVKLDDLPGNSGAPINWQGDWLTATVYSVGDGVTNAGSSYACIINHTSGTFATDLAASKWQLVAEKGAPGSGAGNYETSSNLGSAAAIATHFASSDVPVFLDDDVAVSSAVYTLPANAKFVLGGGKFVKSGSGKIDFDGDPGFNPFEQSAAFSGFAVGDVTFTGTTYPKRISMMLWDNASWTDKLKAVQAATVGKDLTVGVYPGAHDKFADLGEGRSWHFTRGTYTDTMNSTDGIRFSLGDNTIVYGDGIGQTIYEGSSVTRNVRIFYASGVVNYPYDGDNENIEVRDLWIKGGSPTFFDNGPVTVYLGNGRNCHARNVKITDVATYGIYFGGFSTSGFYAKDSSVTNCIFDNVHGQMTGCLNGENVLIDGCTFTNIQQDTSTLISVMDFEPNTATDRVIGMTVVNNIIDGRDALQYYNGLVFQTGGATSPLVGGLVANNQFITAGNVYLSNPYFGSGLKDYVFQNNYSDYANQSSVYLSQSERCYIRGNTFRDMGSGSVAKASVIACWNCRFDNNFFDNVNGAVILDAAGTKVVETELTVTVNTSSTLNTVTRSSGLFLSNWAGRTVTITGVDYVVNTVASDGFSLTLTTNPGTHTGSTLTTKFSDNKYTDNFVPSGYTLLGTSRVISAKDRVVRDSIASTISAQADNWYPGHPTYRIDVTATGAQNITGLDWNIGFINHSPVDGEEHMIYNAGASNVTLKHDTTSTAANRFKCNTGGDIVLAAGEAAKIVYISSASRWWATEL